MKIILYLLIISCCLPAAAQTKSVLYVKLSRTLDSLAAAEQHHLQALAGSTASASTYANVLAERSAFCARHQQFLEGIVKKYGFPGIEEVGETSSNHFVQLVQHADASAAFQRRVLRLMAAQLKRNNASQPIYAYLANQVGAKSGRRATALR